MVVETLLAAILIVLLFVAYLLLRIGSELNDRLRRD